MAGYMILGRTEYAQPLELVTTVEADAAPALDDLEVGSDWLELVAVPADEVIWVLRDGAPVGRWAARVTAGGT